MRALYFLVLFGITGFLCAEERVWTSSDGRTIEGTILGFEDGTVRLETSRGKFELPLSRLSEKDQTFVKEWSEKMAAAEEKGDQKKNVAVTLGNFDDLKPGVWPQYVVADLEVDQIKTVDNPESSEYIYRTPHFEFFSPERLSNSVVREFARIFEATYAFVDQMPMGLAPQPSANGFYQTQLYVTREAYFANGGMPGSAGMFSFRFQGKNVSGKVHVPLPNLGVEYTGTRFIVDHKKRSDTLIHEIVHQVMMRWLVTAMPVWLSEGFAEVISSQEYNNGRFKLNSMDRAVAEQVTRGNGRDFTMVNLEYLMNMSHEQWSADVASGKGGGNYNSACVLTYYYLKLAGKGDGAYLINFLKDLTTGSYGDDIKDAQANFLIRERSYEQLQEELAEAWRSEGLKIVFD